MPTVLVFTIFQCLWAIWWLCLHLRIRKNRSYATDRKAVHTNLFYQIVSPLLYLMQNGLCLASFWSNSPWLLKFHDSDICRSLGFLLFFFGSNLYFWALLHLGKNYSPCYDSHLPSAIVRTGPYQWIRHPMYGAKLLIGLATIIVSGSLWFVPTILYFFGVTIRSMLREEAQLRQLAPGYIEYQARTKMIVPWIG